MIGLMAGVVGRARLPLCAVGAALLVAGCDQGIKKENQATWGRIGVLQAKVDGTPIGGIATMEEPIWAESATVRAGQTYNATVKLSGPAPAGGITCLIVYSVDGDNSVSALNSVLDSIVNSVIVPQGAQQFMLPFTVKTILPGVRHVDYWVHAQIGGGSAHGTITVTP